MTFLRVKSLLSKHSSHFQLFDTYFLRSIISRLVIVGIMLELHASSQHRQKIGNIHLSFLTQELHLKIDLIVFYVTYLFATLSPLFVIFLYLPLFDIRWRGCLDDINPCFSADKWYHFIIFHRN